MFQHDSFFFIGVFVFIFLLWLVLGGPSRPLSFSGPLLPGPGALGGGTYLSLPQAISLGSSGIGGSRASGGSPLGGLSGGLSYKDQRALDEAVRAAAFGTPSSYRGRVTLSHHVANAGGANAQSEYLQLSIGSSAGASASISGWSLKSEVTGKVVTIPLGTEIPRSGIINEAEPIVLEPGDKVIITTGRSPIGASFRENICIGYFSQFQKFSPSLSNVCPTPDNELEDFYGPNLIRDPACIDYVDRLPRCTLQITPPTNLSASCQHFLTTYLHYNGCMVAHERDQNFKRTTWRVYLGRDTSMWRSDREVVKLIDTEGKTVDMFSY